MYITNCNKSRDSCCVVWVWFFFLSTGQYWPLKKVTFQWVKCNLVQNIVHLWKQTLSWPVISERGKKLFCKQTVFLKDRPGSGRETLEPVLTLPGKRNEYHRQEKEQLCSNWISKSAQHWSDPCFDTQTFTLQSVTTITFLYYISVGK